MSKLPEVETYLGFAAVQRQQLCQQILSAIDAVKLPNKKKFAPQDVQNVLEELKASLFTSVQQVMEKDAQATAGLLTNALTSREAGEGGQKGQETTSGLNAHDCIMARHALHDIQQCHASILGRVEQFKSDLQQQRNL